MWEFNICINLCWRKWGNGPFLQMLPVKISKVPEISGVILISTGDWVQRMLHSKINESLIDDLDAGGTRDCPTQFTKAHRHIEAYYIFLLSYVPFIGKSFGTPQSIIQFRCHFTSLPWPQMYKIKHLGMHTASASICERTRHSQKLASAISLFLKFDHY